MNEIIDNTKQTLKDEHKSVFKDLRIGYVFTGSFCTFETSFKIIEELIQYGAEIIPIMSYNAAEIDTRFGKAAGHIARLEELTGKKVIKTIDGAEPIGPKKMCDILVVAPCTGNTLAKLAHSITDTPATMAVKSHIRGCRPVIISVATNDALAGSAKNIGMLMNFKYYYFVPLKQDDEELKPASVVADFEKIPEVIVKALEGKQLQPMFM